MARKLRVEYPGAVYHVMNRGDRREPIFRDDADRQRFVNTLGEACGKTGWQVHALCLMPNHFHMVLETPRGNLVAGMKWFLGTYTGRFNRRHKLFGHLFSGRYKALIVDGSGNGYLKAVCDYVHLNPARAKLLRSGQALREYRWSSYRGRALGIPDALLDEDPWYTGLGIHAKARQQAYQAWVDAAVRADEWTHIRQATQQGRVIGTEQFQREIEAMLGRRLVGELRGRPRKDRLAITPHDSDPISPVRAR